MLQASFVFRLKYQLKSLKYRNPKTIVARLQGESGSEKEKVLHLPLNI